MHERAELRAWLDLLGRVGRSTARRLLSRHGGPEAVLSQAALPEHKQPFDTVWDNTQRWLDADPRHGVLLLGDPDYPAPLMSSADPPLALFLAGDRTQLGRSAVAIVGSRQATPQGLELAHPRNAAGCHHGVVFGRGDGVAAHALERGAWLVPDHFVVGGGQPVG